MLTQGSVVRLADATRREAATGGRREDATTSKFGFRYLWRKLVLLRMRTWGCGGGVEVVWRWCGEACEEVCKEVCEGGVEVKKW